MRSLPPSHVVLSARRFPSFAAAALALTAPLSLALAAGFPEGEGPLAALAATVECPSEGLARAESLIARHKPVAARAILVRAFQQGTTPKEEAGRAMELLGKANAAIRMMDPLAVSLQKAEVAIGEGDVRVAERHVQAVLRSAAVSAEQTVAAREVAAAIEARRQELSPVVPDALAQAERDFEAGRYAQAKAGFEMVDRSGVELSEGEKARLDQYQMKLVVLATKNPDLFSATASMGMMQPGVVKRREPAAQPAEPAQPEPAPQPAPAAQERPMVVPEPAPAPAPGDDPINQAQKFEAQSLLAQADRAFDEGRLNEAQGRYWRLRTEFRDFLSPAQLQHVENRLEEARVRMGAPGTAPRPEDVLAQQAIAKQQAIAEFESDMGQAKRALDSGAVEDARTAAARARLRLSSARQLFSETEYEAMNARVSDLLVKVDSTAAKIREEAQRQADIERTEREKAASVQQLAERERKIVELIDRARAYQAELRYAEALQAVDQLLFLDPINPTGLLLRDLIIDIMVYIRSNDIYDRKQLGYAQDSLNNQEASIPPAGIVTFPLDWPKITTRRGEPLAFAESPENRRVLAELGATNVPNVPFNNSPLQDATQFLATIIHQNVDVDWASLENVGITRDTPVTMNLANVSANRALDLLIEKISGMDRGSRADWAILDGVVTIASEDRIRRNTALVIYDVRDLLIEVPDYRDVPRIDLQQALQAAQGGAGGGQSPFQEAGGDEDPLEQLRNREERLDDLISILTNNIDYDGWVDNGGDTGKIQKMVNSGNLIITNTPKNHRAIAGLLSQLREIRAMQINVETRFLLVNQDWFEQIGFDIDVYFNADNNQIRGTTNKASEFFGEQGEYAQPAGVANPDPWSPIGVTGNSLNLAQGLAPASDWAGTILGASPALGVAGQFLDDVQVDFLIKATQADRRSIQLTAPRLTFTNGQIANIYVATQQAFVSDLQPVVGDSAVGFDPTVGVVTEGVTLLVEGTVTADRRYVQLNVDAGVARIDGFGQQSVSAVAGGQLVSSAAVQSFIQLPRVTVTRVRTTVTVPDQGTILMGGQRLVTEFEVETGVPVLSKIPILNRFFTNRIESKEEQTLLILIKPTILIQNEEEEQNFPGLLESMRSGLGG